MNCDNLDRSFIEYLEQKGIKCVEKFNEELSCDYSNIKEINNQIEAINQFHIRTMGYTGYMNKRLANNIGKTIENYKIYIKRLNKLIKKINENGIENEFEKEVIKYGTEYLERAKQCINGVYSNEYVSLILRSMQRSEVCLGSTFFNNLRLRKDIEIVSIKNCCYNMVEMDFVYFINKLKRRDIKIDFVSFIDEICYIENLDKNSNKFILSLVSYPYEFIKCCSRYREKSKEWNNNEYIYRLHKAIKLDGDSLI